MRLDLIAALLVKEEEHIPPGIEVAYLLPVSTEQQDVARLSARSPAELDLDFPAFIHSLEEELARRHKTKKSTAGQDRAILVCVSNLPRDEAEEHLNELEELAATAGLKVLDRVVFRSRNAGSRLVLSQDRARRLNIMALQTGADLLVFDQDLAPAQINRISDLTELRIIDRTQLILDIFAQRAQSREGKIQVEMAQLNYLLPRLVFKNTAMSRLTGGIGARGPGETKLEINRRRVRERIDRLKKDLNNIKGRRHLHRERRARLGLPIVSIVGYTNAGKSTLLNRLTQSEVLAEDRLFATLDPSSRRLRFPRDRSIIITDTVGFIRDLPPALIEAFSATLEELSKADLLLHVIDSSSRSCEEQILIVEELLRDLELTTAPMIRVFNKKDLISPKKAEDLARHYNGLAISALDRSTFPPLIDEIAARLGWTPELDPVPVAG